MSLRSTSAGLLLLLSGAASATAQDLKVVVSIKPVHALVSQVMSGVGTPRVIVDGSTSPHTFTLRPSDAKAFNNADVLFRVSDGVEPFTTKIAASLPRSVQVVSLDQTPGLIKLARRASGPFEKQAHGASKHDDHGHAKAGAEIDGHIWLDPENAKLIVDRIAHVLSAKAPQHAAKFAENSSAAKIKIDQLARDLEIDLKPLAGKSFIVFHDAYQYFERRFGLSAAGSISTNPETPPSAKRLVDMRAKIASLKAVCVFSEPNFEAKVVQTIAEGTSAKTGTLDPEGVTTPSGPEHYDTMMRKLAEGIKGCLGGLS
jgi:zinc transport system substrate-binding protein